MFVVTCVVFKNDVSSSKLFRKNIKKKSLPKEAVDPTYGTQAEMNPEEALSVLGLQNFRHRQREVIDDILSSATDYVVTLPTGWGKSLLYLVPIISRGSPAVIVSPLVSLIYDQCAKINRSSRKMAYNISSSCSEDIPDEDAVFCDEQLSVTGPLLIFCTPEKVATVSFRQKLERLHAARPFSYFVLDEAHLMEQGQSFRPDYMKLDYLRRTLAPDVPILCFSATCNDSLRGFLVRSLSLRNVRYVVERECRENMHLSVHYVSKKSKTCSCGSGRCSWKHGAQSLHEDARKIISTCKGGRGARFDKQQKGLRGALRGPAGPVSRQAGRHVPRAARRRGPRLQAKGLCDRKHRLFGCDLCLVWNRGGHAAVEHDCDFWGAFGAGDARPDHWPRGQAGAGVLRARVCA